MRKIALRFAPKLLRSRTRKAVIEKAKRIGQMGVQQGRNGEEVLVAFKLDDEHFKISGEV